MMLGCDKGRTTKRGVGDDKDDKELMDDEEEKDKIEEVETEMVSQIKWSLLKAWTMWKGRSRGEINDDTSCEYGSSHFIEQIFTL